MTFIILQDFFRVSHWMVLSCILLIYTAFLSIHGSRVEPYPIDAFD